MKNFPHQFNDIEKLFNALSVAERLINNNTPLTDEYFGEQLTREEIYTYRDKSLSIDQFLQREKLKPKAKRSYLTVSRDIRRFLELLGFIIVLNSNKYSRITTTGKQLLTTTSDEQTRQIWKSALLQLGLEGTDGEISHPYRILLKIVNTFPGIETKKLMLALEARNDSDDEFERIRELSKLSVAQIIRTAGAKKYGAANAVKILPGIAEQLNDIKRISNKAYPCGHIIITEDEITTEKEIETGMVFEETSAEEIAKDPLINIVSSVSIDITDAIKKRQKRLVEHQEVVRLLAIINEKCGIELFKGKFDCLGKKGDIALLYEVKTIIESLNDQERQTIRGVGQLKYYKFSILQQMKLDKIKEILVFSKKPENGIINFCTAENIAVIWRDGDSFQIYNVTCRANDTFNPDEIL